MAGISHSVSTSEMPRSDPPSALSYIKSRTLDIDRERHRVKEELFSSLTEAVCSSHMYRDEPLFTEMEESARVASNIARTIGRTDDALLRESITRVIGNLVASDVETTFHPTYGNMERRARIAAIALDTIAQTSTSRLLAAKINERKVPPSPPRGSGPSSHLTHREAGGGGGADKHEGSTGATAAITSLLSSSPVKVRDAFKGLASLTLTSHHCGGDEDGDVGEGGEPPAALGAVTQTDMDGTNILLAPLTVNPVLGATDTAPNSESFFLSSTSTASTREGEVVGGDGEETVDEGEMLRLSHSSIDRIMSTLMKSNGMPTSGSGSGVTRLPPSQQESSPSPSRGALPYPSVSTHSPTRQTPTKKLVEIDEDLLSPYYKTMKPSPSIDNFFLSRNMLDKSIDPLHHSSTLEVRRERGGIPSLPPSQQAVATQYRCNDSYMSFLEKEGLQSIRDHHNILSLLRGSENPCRAAAAYIYHASRQAP